MSKLLISTLEFVALIGIRQHGQGSTSASLRSPTSSRGATVPEFGGQHFGSPCDLLGRPKGREDFPLRLYKHAKGIQLFKLLKHILKLHFRTLEALLHFRSFPKIQKEAQAKQQFSSTYVPGRLVSPVNCTPGLK